MIEINKNASLWAQIISEEIIAVDTNPALTTFEKFRRITALAKSAHKIEDDSTFIHFDPADKSLLLFTDSANVYRVSDQRCQCRDALYGDVCWHRAAHRLISRFALANAIEKQAPTEVF